eukprot:CAMPEP_0175057566 /NCGR_PEP_ID=MMETSP0052_2-20121109/11332_1 /TAXON_ID=51329 ORGANISM="Polytomella parva, Strain SAG 63-3" /NCGR_SAMPLE_ID=MMETSP0052_2 /ASSEMBLY_ACC=CAM_ASM_000194 /LENGTH=42 /DNA_ID= /DNA_START= /DNA_END= /DNA_ORIENTATION=
MEKDEEENKEMDIQESNLGDDHAKSPANSQKQTMIVDLNELD